MEAKSPKKHIRRWRAWSPTALILMSVVIVRGEMSGFSEELPERVIAGSKRPDGTVRKARPRLLYFFFLENHFSHQP